MSPILFYVWFSYDVWCMIGVTLSALFTFLIALQLDIFLHNTELPHELLPSHKWSKQKQLIIIKCVTSKTCFFGWEKMQRLTKCSMSSAFVIFWSIWLMLVKKSVSGFSLWIVDGLIPAVLDGWSKTACAFSAIKHH